MLILLLILTIINLSNAQKNIVCYYTNWAQYRVAPGTFLPENINASLCTHINYAFAKIVNDQLAGFELNDEDNGVTQGMYRRVIKKKSENPNLKVLLSVGGWSIGSKIFSDIARDSTRRQRFISSTINYLRNYGFDGLDIDWEYPAARDGRPDDKQYFSLLLKETKTAFLPYNLLLTAAVAAGVTTLDNGYDIPEISKYLDLINIMTYDYFGPWDNKIGHNAPLNKRIIDTSTEATMNVNFSINYFLRKGAPRNKIVVGLGFYGHSFKLANIKNILPGSLASSPGIAGAYTREPGILGYFEICSLLQTSGWTRVWDTEQRVPYIYNNLDWISYDDIQSLTEKVNYVKSLNLGGIMIWDLDFDDFNGNFCKQGKYPLLSLVKQLLQSIYNPSSITSIKPTTKTTSSIKNPSIKSTTTTKNPAILTKSTNISKPTTRTTTASTSIITKSTQIYDPKIICTKGDGLYPDYSSKCKNFFNCVHTSTIYAIVYIQSCGNGLLFNDLYKTCDWENNVKCIQ